MGCGASTVSSAPAATEPAEHPKGTANDQCATATASAGLSVALLTLPSSQDGHNEKIGRVTSAPATPSVASKGPAAVSGTNGTPRKRNISGRPQPGPENCSWAISDQLRERLFNALDKDGDKQLDPAELEPWMISKSVHRLLFGTLDKDGSNTLDAAELMSGIWRLGSQELDEDAITKLVREVDVNGDGEVALDEFLELVQVPPAPAEDFAPHLVLNFDVNQTILMLDSATGSDNTAMVNEVLANAAWGRVSDVEGTPTWTLVSSKPERRAPDSGLKTYYQFALQDLQQPKGWRQMVRRFTFPDEPGAALHHFAEEMEAALSIPKDVADAAGEELLTGVGLLDGRWQLLPSFLHGIRSLKQANRSFSVCFRTFGHDLDRIVGEWNAFCENRHPLFLASKDAPVLLDGSDGGPDYRLSVAPGSPSCGTWLRSEQLAAALVLGCIEQPPLAEVANGSVSSFYKAAEAPVEIFMDVEAARQKFRELFSPPGRAMALRDYFPGWQQCGGRQAAWGKPFFIDLKEVDTLHLFMDDHILPNDAKIVDARSSVSDFQRQIPIGACFGTHLLRAEPLESIADMDYFKKAIAGAEANWRAACRRRRAAAEAISLYAAALATKTPLEFLRSHEVQLPVYEPWALSSEVVLATDVSLLGEEDDETLLIMRAAKSSPA